jgi:hypothetical protein
MTDLAQVVWDCKAIKGMDKLVLMGWTEQVEEGMDVAYCSKTTVADFLGVSLDTVKRRTHALVAAGWMVDTGERKQWEPDCWTPVYRLNLEKLVELDFGGADCTGGAEKAGVQIAPQGSGSRSRSASLTHPLASSSASAADLRSAAATATPENGEARQKPRTENPKPKVKTCPSCGEPWQRDKNHACMDKPITPIPSADFHDDIMDMPPRRNAGCMGERMEFVDDGYDGKPLFNFGSKPDGTPKPKKPRVFIACRGKGHGCPATISPELWPESDGWCAECVEHGCWSSGAQAEGARQDKATSKANA